MKMIYLFSLFIMISTACNNGKSSSQVTSDVDSVSVNNEDELQSTADVVKTTFDTMQTEEKEMINPNTDVGINKVIENKEDKVSTKSVPKSKTIEKHEALENVDTKLNKSDKTAVEKIIPKPEKKEKDEPLTKVELSEVDNNTSKKIANQHIVFDQLLKSNVDNYGNVDYLSFKSQNKELEGYLDQLSSTIVDNLKRDEKLAFWINAYNAFTIKLIIDNYPVAKITDLENGKPWDKKWISIDGKTISLNQIENEIIRPQFNEPRIHFAVNCAAKSCPPLLNQAWTADNLEHNLNKQTKNFINNSTYNQLSEDKVILSKIFEWYAADFGDLIHFINKYAKTRISENANVEYAEYNWNLNKK